MNWTEGKLARHSRARQSKQTVLRQKEHFAKARARLVPNASKQIPPSLSHIPSETSPRNEGSALAAPQQRGPTPSSNLERPSAGKRRRWSSSPKGPVSINQQVSARHFSTTISRPHNPGPPPVEVVDDAAIREKRQKLLRDKDWAGTRIQKPIPVHFEQNPSDGRKWARRQRSTASRPGHLVRDRYNQTRQVNEKVEQPQWNRDVRITIGSQEVRLGQETSTGQSDYAPVAPKGGQAYSSRNSQVYGGETMPISLLTSSSSVADPREKPKTSHRLQHGKISSLGSISESSGEKGRGMDEKASPLQLQAPVAIRRVQWLPPAQSPDREAGGSMLADVGAQLSPMPLSRLEQNEAWRTLVTATQSNTSYVRSSIGRPQQSDRPRISPGISTRHHQLVSAAASLNEPTNSCSLGTDTSGGYQYTSSYNSGQLDGYQSHSMVSASGPSLPHPDINTSPDNQGSASYYSAQSRSASDPDAYEHPTGDTNSGRSVPGDVQSSLGDAAASSSPEATDGLPIPRDTNLVYDDSSLCSTGIDTYSVDQRVADFHKAALKLVSRRAPTPWKPQGRVNVDTPMRNLQYASADSNSSSQKPSTRAATSWRIEGTESLDESTRSPKCSSAHGNSSPPEHSQNALQELQEITAGTIQEDLPKMESPGKEPLRREPCRPEPPRAESPRAESPRAESPRDESDDIWFKYIFSDSNTEELHREVLEQGAKESARDLLQQAAKEDPTGISESDWGHNISTATTHGQSSISATATRDHLTSASAVSASHSAAIGSPVTTGTAGTVLDGWEGSGGPPYAASSSLQGSTDSGTTLPVQHMDSRSVGQGLSQSVTNVTSSFSSKAVEPPQSVATHVPAKESFRFAPPKLFVGKLSESVPSARPAMAIKPVTLTKPKRGRPKRKARDGRANIKGIPVYHDDPIEDFDSSPPARVEASLFGALDME